MTLRVVLFPVRLVEVVVMVLALPGWLLALLVAEGRWEAAREARLWFDAMGDALLGRDSPV